MFFIRKYEKNKLKCKNFGLFFCVSEYERENKKNYQIKKQNIAQNQSFVQKGIGVKYKTMNTWSFF